MEQPLRCNNQAGGFCRATLTDTAVVTTCSHIFCTNCSERTGFASSPLQHRACPVCRTLLPNNDDAVQTRLSPSEDYKTSVLSGLDPTTIMECAGRALAFWTYQTTQEIFYQEHLCKNLTNKYSNLSNAMDKIINEANTEISNLQNKISSLSIDQKSLQQRFDELATVYKDKSKKYTQTQQLYDTLKKKVLMRRVETAASDNVNNTLQSMNSQQRPATYQGQPYEHGVIPQREMSDNGRFGELVQPQRQMQGPSRAPLRPSQDMPPPPRPVHSHGIAAAATPQHRTVLPGAPRPTANRSQIPMSTARIDTRHSLNMPHVSHTSSLRNQVHMDGPINRVGTTTPRGYGGISNGMKVGTGRAGIDDGIMGNARYNQHDSEVPRFHRPANSLDDSRGFY